MNNTDKDIDNIMKIEKVYDFLNIKKPLVFKNSIKEAVKEVCVARLCKEIGITGNYNYKSKFFDLFSSIMGQAISEKLSLKICIASDALRLFKYEKINLIEEVKKFLDTETVEEAFIDAFDLVDKFKYLIFELSEF